MSKKLDFDRIVQELIDASNSEGYAERGEQWPMQPYYDRTHKSRDALMDAIEKHISGVDADSRLTQPERNAGPDGWCACKHCTTPEACRFAGCGNAQWQAAHAWRAGERK